MNGDTEHEKFELVEGRIRILNLIATYLIELNEYRAEIYTALKFSKITPSIKQNFFKSFRRFYDITSGVVEDEDLKADVEKWFQYYTDEDINTGIELSLKYQKALEKRGIFPVFQMKITPPYL